MNSVIVCHGCGRTIDSEFLYCPWCSLSRVTSDAELSIAGVFDRLNRMQETTRSIQITSLIEQLDEIESDLDKFTQTRGTRAKKTRRKGLVAESV